jgi:hypothetical protein
MPKIQLPNHTMGQGSGDQPALIAYAGFVVDDAQLMPNAVAVFAPKGSDLGAVVPPCQQVNELQFSGLEGWLLITAV